MVRKFFSNFNSLNNNNLLFHKFHNLQLHNQNKKKKLQLKSYPAVTVSRWKLIWLWVLGKYYKS